MKTFLYSQFDDIPLIDQLARCIQDCVSGLTSQDASNLPLFLNSSRNASKKKYAKQTGTNELNV